MFPLNVKEHLDKLSKKTDVFHQPVWKLVWNAVRGWRYEQIAAQEMKQDAF